MSEYASLVCLIFFYLLLLRKMHTHQVHMSIFEKEFVLVVLWAKQKFHPKIDQWLQELVCNLFNPLCFFFRLMRQAVQSFLLC